MTTKSNIFATYVGEVQCPDCESKVVDTCKLPGASTGDDEIILSCYGCGHRSVHTRKECTGGDCA